MESLGDDDGLDHIPLCHFRTKVVVDSLTEDNSHQGDIYQLESKQKPAARKLKTFQLAKDRKIQNKNKKTVSTTFEQAKGKKGQKKILKPISEK